MELNVLQANYGDAIHLRFKDEENYYRNILIDGGTSDTYEFKDVRGIHDGDLKQIIKLIRDRGEVIDLLILTHVDDDHIGGILKFFGKETPKEAFIRKVWFNSGRLIFEYFREKEIEDNLLQFNVKSSLNTSIPQGVIFEKYIKENNMWDGNLIKALDKINLFGLKFTILSPSEDNLKSLLCKWEKEVPNLDTTRSNDYHISLKKHIELDTFREDKSIHNGSSIAFFIEYDNKRILFLGDAFPQTVTESLKQLGYSSKNPLRLDFVKLSHHGSKANTSTDLLDLIESENFIISSNGDRYQLPDKQCLARIVNHKEKANIFFNYPSMINKIFTIEDLNDFPGLKVLPIKDIMK